MSESTISNLEEAYPVCRSILNDREWDMLARRFEGSANDFPEWLGCHSIGLPRYLPELALLERTFGSLGPLEHTEPDGQYVLNPTIRILDLSWKGLAGLLLNGRVSEPEPGSEKVLLWRRPGNSDPAVCAASNNDLLALKIVAEERDCRIIARDGNIPLSSLFDLLERTADKGLILRSPSRVQRQFSSGRSKPELKRFLSAEYFTLQWHITHACDLHCRHCYDRGKRNALDYDTAVRVLDDLYAFCSDRCVRGQITFTGGHPLLYPRFTGVYRAAAERGFSVAIAGNPDKRETIEELISIQMPSFYQISLEGLEEHNNAVRGKGHFYKSLQFLEMLREMSIYSMVMLTLTRDNIDQVLPLAEFLRGKTDVFNFNRLSMVGEGAQLLLPDKDRFQGFLDEYLKASRDNRTMKLKDNLINIMLEASGGECFGGCTGHGCGAAFNFLSLLPDGEVHACRKFPSLIGTIREKSLAEIYDSSRAELYRAVPSSCSTCSIRPVCGGCQAVIYSSGLDVIKDRDPFCFK